MDNKKEVFNALKSLLKTYSPPFVPGAPAKTDKPQFSLVSKKKVTIAGRERDEVWFAGIIMQKNYVGFYYMPIYATENLKKIFPRELLALLKGKSCFYIKELTPQLKTQIKKALDLGVKEYKKCGWI